MRARWAVVCRDANGEVVDERSFRSRGAAEREANRNGGEYSLEDLHRDQLAFAQAMDEYARHNVRARRPELPRTYTVEVVQL